MTAPRKIVLVTGLSGAGKASIMGAFEDLGFAAIDNPPLTLVHDLVAKTERPLAIGVDCRTHGFDETVILAALEILRANPGLSPELVFALADDEVLLRRYTETRRRHPLAPQGSVAAGIAAEQALTATLRAAADLVIDTSELPLSGLRQIVERRFGLDQARDGQSGMAIALISFAYPAGLPRQADLVFDARFLRNPHYDLTLRPLTGLDKRVSAYVMADPDYAAFYNHVWQLLQLVLPRFVKEGKKYTSIAIGCTGGKHRSVHLIEALSRDLAKAGCRPHVSHRELARTEPQFPAKPGNRAEAKMPSPPQRFAADGIDPHTTIAEDTQTA
jgi:UPF0042 nucleotide-binding protein